MSERKLTPEQKAIKNDPAYWDHFDQWWAQDFSWEGLRKQKIQNHPDGHTLQDYWREEEDKLIEFSGRKWTRFHLPPHDREGKTSEKWGVAEEDWQTGEWKDWRDEIQKKFNAACENDSDEPDTRAQFQGICFPDWLDLSANPPDYECEEDRKTRTLHINAKWARFGDWVDFTKATFGNWVSFDNATLGIVASFHKATFGYGASFHKVTFGYRDSFHKATFGYRASFHKATFGNVASFDSATFSSEANFEQATFGDLALLDHATFGDSANFTNATFGNKASFYKATFGGGASFDEVTFGVGARFVEVTFGSVPKFYKATFVGRASFDKATFGYWTSFDEAIFGDMASFDEAIFGEGAKFINTTFGKFTSFRDSQFGAGLKFDKTDFNGPAKFHNAEFHSDTSFDDADFALPQNDEPVRASEYQSAFRVLRQHMEKLGNYGQAHKFARLEMRAREMRHGSKDVPFWVRTLSRMYGLFSDYGQSAMRPIFWLLGLFGMAVIAYLVLGWPHGTLGDAIGVAFQSSLPPISFAISEFYAGTTDPIFLNQLYAHPFLTRAVMVSHGTLSIALVFFLLLALKRRFQLR